MSDDGRHGLTIIAFIGSVFSPYYAWARRRGDGDPLNHCALNVALYGGARKRWAMTERGRASTHRDRSSFVIGPSGLSWDGSALTIRIDEITVPVPTRIRGRVRLHPAFLVEQSFALDTEGRHRWRPIAPCARVEVELEQPALRWAGAGYLDTNDGDAPLEDTFAGWSWSRASLRDGTVVLYDVLPRNSPESSIALRFDPSGKPEEFAPPELVPLPATLWRVDRSTRAEPSAAVAVLRTLEDAPFYARSILATRLLNEPVTAIHESLSLDRFRAGWVRLLLPFRMPRARR